MARKKAVSEPSGKPLVVVHFLDGEILKGTTIDFSAERGYFHLSSFHGDKSIRVLLGDVKAVFFVKDLEGESKRRDMRGFLNGPLENRHGKKIAVFFPDGELVCGYSLSYLPQRPGFFIFPADAGSNNLRIFVNAAPGTKVQQREAAEELAQRVMDSRAA